ncbi:MAG: efflux RND transporter periplasmic adaptor subunit [Rhodospirillaceae bacterium]|nr:efflux RND transporter periplasmic adaptor subunit [Rhodospirillaceae bacterium]
MKPVPLVVGVLALAGVVYGGYAYLHRESAGTDPAATKTSQRPPGQVAPGAPGPGRATPGRREVPPAPVVVAAVRVESVPVTLSAIGNVQAVSTVSIKSQVDGQIRQVHFKEGQTIKKGDLLFTLDPRPYEAALRQAEANLAKDKALLDKARADLARLAPLVERDFASRANYDTAKANVASLDATIKADEALVEQARLKLEFTRITAPIDGRAGSILVSAGNLVKANDTASGALVMLNQIKPIYVQFAVPERQIADIRARMAQNRIPVEVVIPGHAQAPIDGTLTFINNSVDSTTGTIQLKATFDNGDELLVPGQFVNVTVEMSRIENALVIPAVAVQLGQNGSYVFVVKADSTVEMRPIRTGVTAGKDIVIEQGLQRGERVVLEGQLRLRPGSRVSVRTAATQRRSPPLADRPGQVPE